RTYSFGATYDANSRLATVAYPSGFTAHYGYTALGYASQLQDNSSGQSWWTAGAMDAEGHLMEMGAGIEPAQRMPEHTPDLARCPPETDPTGAAGLIHPSASRAPQAARFGRSQRPRRTRTHSAVEARRPRPHDLFRNVFSVVRIDEVADRIREL